MTEPRGALGARPGEGGGGEDDAVEPADQLTAMRAVWLAMRDEEPSSGGLAELLAAARTQAAARQPRPSRWQRAMAGLSRPPVFAFATALVLVAGAVVVARNVKQAVPPVASGRVGEAANGVGRQAANGGEEVAASEMGRAAVPNEAPGSAQQEARSSVMPGSVARPGSAQEEASSSVMPSSVARSSAPGAVSPPVNAAAAPASRPVRGAAGGDSASAPSPSRRASVSSAADEGAAGATIVEDRATSKDQRVGAEATAASGRTSASRSAVAARPQGAEPSRVQEERATVPSEHSAAAPAAPAAADGQDTRGQDTRGRRVEPTLDQQCEAAAARGDCATARRLVDRIGATDRAYRARIVAGSPIAKCLETGR